MSPLFLALAPVSHHIIFNKTGTEPSRSTMYRHHRAPFALPGPRKQFPLSGNTPSRKSPPGSPPFKRESISRIQLHRNIGIFNPVHLPTIHTAPPLTLSHHKLSVHSQLMHCTCRSLPLWPSLNRTLVGIQKYKPHSSLRSIHAPIIPNGASSWLPKLTDVPTSSIVVSQCWAAARLRQEHDAPRTGQSHLASLRPLPSP